MGYLILKYALSAAIIVAVAEIAKRNLILAGFVASLPLTSLLAFAWLYHDTHETGRVAELSYKILWLVLPSLVLFLALPLLLRHGVGFYPALALSTVIMLAAYGLEYAGLRFLGVKL